ncbi:MAG: hypothetical protein HFH13_08960 [Dorea sp.]|nr:hypothetical protein [Dorea sp.]
MKIYIWGTGYIANQTLKNSEILKKYEVKGFIDNDACKQGKQFYNREIYAPDILLSEKVDKIVILTKNYEDIYQQIKEKMKLHQIEIEDWLYFYKQFTVKPRILERYKDSGDWEIKEVLEYIKNNELCVFNYGFREKYKYSNQNVVFDEACGMFYVMHQEKKMYFAKYLNTKEKVIDYYRSILLEQDENSPHKYLSEEFKIYDGDIVVDVGVAEGNFALEVIDRVSKIYLIESDCEWVKALNETFKEYQDKVVIVEKFLNVLDDGKYATLDGLVKEPVNFIKMDIEGNEWNALLGTEKLIRKSPKLQCAICSYHSDYDEILIKDILTKYGLQCTTTLGYMWYPSAWFNEEMSFKLCRGIVRGVKWEVQK